MRRAIRSSLLVLALTVAGSNEPILRSRQATTGKPFLRITHTP